MYIKLTLENLNGTNMVVPYHYEEWIQAFLYSLNDVKFGSFLHNVGYRYENRTYKLFCFSNILERPLKILREKHQFIFPYRINIIVSTVENGMLDALFKSAYEEHSNYYLGNGHYRYNISISEIGVLEPPRSTDIIVETKSPVCINSTLYKPDGSPWTQYFRPDDKQFGNLIRDNAIKKYVAFYGMEPVDKHLNIQHVGRFREVKSSYKKFLIIGYSGKFRLTGSEELIRIMMQAGMGSRNAEGKGLIFPVEQLS